MSGRRTTDGADRHRLWDPARPNTHRSVLFSAIAATIAAAAAGASLLSAPNALKTAVPPDAVAVVNGRPINRTDYGQLLQSKGIEAARATPAQRHATLDQLIREELLVQRANEMDTLSFDEDARLAMVNSVEQSIAADALSGSASEAKLRAFYQLHRDQFSAPGELMATELIVPASAAATAMQALSKGEPPARLAARLKGRLGRSTEGTDFYFAAELHLGQDLYTKAVGQPAGSASIDRIAADGAHLLYVSANTAPAALPFEQVRKDVLGAYRTQSVSRIQQADEGYFRKRANILIARDLR